MTSFEVMHEVDEAILKIGDDFDTEFLSSMEEKTPSYQKIGHVDFLEIKFKDLPTTCRVSPDYSEWSIGPRKRVHKTRKCKPKNHSGSLDIHWTSMSYRVFKRCPMDTYRKSCTSCEFAQGRLSKGNFIIFSKLCTLTVSNKILFALCYA